MTPRRLAGRALASWIALWRRVEGPELEPSIWHSHYLTSRASRDALDALGAQLRGMVIDIGAGTGHGASYLDRDQTTYFPTDLPDGRDFTDARISTSGQAPIQHCSAYDLPFGDGHFGGGLMLMVLEHLERPQQALAEAVRVIEPGGLFLISTPFAFPVHGEPHDFRRWTPQGLEAELRAAGFTVVECRSCGAAFSSLVVNAHLTFRYHLVASGSRVIQALTALFLPLALVVQAMLNIVAVLLDPLDRSRAMPLTIVALARKPVSAA